MPSTLRSLLHPLNLAASAGVLALLLVLGCGNGGSSPADGGDLSGDGTLTPDAPSPDLPGQPDSMTLPDLPADVATPDAPVGPDAGGGAQLPEDTSRDGILAFLQSGAYQQWLSEPAPHASQGPHGSSVRTYFNAAAVKSLQSGSGPHPVGTALVKELYSGSTVAGWSMEIKTAEGTSGDSWLWFEYLPGVWDFYGQGKSLCVGCHVNGNDHVWSQLP